MHAAISAGAGFLLSVLWFDLMFDVQARRGSGGVAPADALASISAYYRRVTTEAAPMPHLVAAVMLAVPAGIVVEVFTAEGARWMTWTSLAAAISAIVLARVRTVPSAVRLGRGGDPTETQTRLARTVLGDHLFCLAAMVIVLALQLAIGLA